MRNLITVLCFLSLKAFVCAQFIYNPFPFKQSDFEKINQHKYTKCLVYKLEGEEKYLQKVAEYGNQGLLADLYEIGFDENGDSVKISEAVYKYDEKGRLIQISETSMDNDDYLAVFTYNKKGKLIKKQALVIDPPTYSYNYDKKGRVTEAMITQLFPALDEDGNWTEKTVEVLTYKYKFTYNDLGQLIGQSVYRVSNENEEFESKHVWEYDQQGRVVAYSLENSEKMALSKLKYEYNEEGLLSRSVFSDDFEAPEEVLVYEYNHEIQSWMK